METATKPRTEFWAEDWEPRDHCYKFIPSEDNKPKFIMNEDWEKLYSRLGNMGYLFRDSGYCNEKIIISLDKEISKEHKKELSLDYIIDKDDGSDLGSARA